MNSNHDAFGTYSLLLILQAGLVAYVWYCVRHGYILVYLRRIERRKQPLTFKWHLGVFILFEAFLLPWLLYHWVISGWPGLKL
jgi:hypothetical protein